MAKRTYKLRERARAQDETRQRIVEAAVSLHEELGPRATSISAIAAKAGVQRLTVYRHFPDEAAIFQACTAHWEQLNPAPDSSMWMGEAEPLARARAAIEAFARYDRRTRGMWSVAYRDAPAVEALAEPMQRYGAHIDATAREIADAFHAEGAAAGRIFETARMVLRFTTWDALAADGLDDAQISALCLAWLKGATGAEPSCGDRGAGEGGKALDLTDAPG
jgi:AcrR family transcriptional regulator